MTSEEFAYDIAFDQIVPGDPYRMDARFGWLAWCICNTVRGLLGGEAVELQKFIPQFDTLEKPLTEDEQLKRDRDKRALELETSLMAALMGGSKLEKPVVHLK